MRAIVCLALACAACATLAGCAPPPPEEGLVEKARLAMGSELRLTAWTHDNAAALSAFDAVFAEFDRLEGLMSTWREGSDVQRINLAAGDHPVPVSPEVREVLRAARQASDWTEGKFDVTWGAMSDIWRFDHDQDNRVPTSAEIRARLPLVNYRALIVDEHAGTAMLERRGMRVHLGGIGKGYAVDRGAAILRAAGFNNFMIQSGGDLYVSGHPGNRPWRLSIRDPRGPSGQYFASLDLEDGTFSTSGDYERFFMKDGRRYHHLLDPDIGEPAQGSRSVTIVANSATVADGLETGIFILGPDKGMALIERLPDVEGVIVTAKNEVLVSSGLKGKILMVRTPTDAP